jgi:hypothetical protein
MGKMRRKKKSANYLQYSQGAEVQVDLQRRHHVETRAATSKERSTAESQEDYP